MNLLNTRHGRALLYTSLYFSEGAPVGFIWWALPTLLRVRGLPLEQITNLTAILVFPWILKFLWAPLVDVLRSERWGIRSWIIGAQLMMCAALVPILWLDPVEHFSLYGMLLFMHALAAATQDVSVDKLAISTVPAGERGRINGFMQGGMLTARSLFGGVSLIVAETLGWQFVITALIAIVGITIGLLMFVREEIPLQAGTERLRAFLERLRAVGKQRITWIGFAFAATAAAGFEAMGALVGPFLIDSGYVQEQVGQFYALPGVASTVVGGVLGGIMADRTGRMRTLVFSVLAFVLTILLVAIPHWRGLDFLVSPFVSLTLLYFFIGMFTASSYALFMDLTDPGLGATQFSAYMGATNACESWSAWAGGQMAATIGYGGSFSVMAGVSVLSLPLLSLLRRKD